MDIRKADFTDYDAIMELYECNGLTTWPYEDWVKVWTKNPCHQATESAPIGWVLEDRSTGIVGTLSNILMPYELNSQPVSVAASSGWVVDRDYRTFGLLLVSRFMQQKSVDLLVTTTANAASQGVLRHFGARRVPHRRYDEVLYWVTCHAGFVESVLRKKELPTSRLYRMPIVLCSRMHGVLTGRNKLRQEVGDTKRISCIDDRFNGFWQKLRRCKNRLMAVRDRETIEWHFGRNAPIVFAVEERGELTGYLAAVCADEPQIGLKRLRVVDCQVANTECESITSIRHLFQSLLRYAQDRGVHVVEVIGFAAWKRRVFEQLRPYRRVLPSWPFLYKAQNQELQNALQNDDAWDPCAYDGDASLW
jgi:hypothetical protein